MIRAMKTTKRDVTYTEGYNWGAQPFEGPPDSSDSTCPCTAPSCPVCTAPSHTPTPPLLGGGWGRCLQVGLFRGRFSPAPLGTSRGPLARDTGRPPVPRCSTKLSAPGAVPGNSSLSLWPPRLQETETQAPPLRRGPAVARVGGWGARGWADPDWAAGPAPPPPAEPGWRRPPGGSAPPRLPRESFESSASRRGCGGLPSAPARGGEGGSRRGLPGRQSRGGRHFRAPTVCPPPTGWREGRAGAFTKSSAPRVLLASSRGSGGR